MNADNMRDGEEGNIFLTDEQAKQTLEDFYRSVAKLAGHEEKEDTLYDCCRILVSANVQDAIIQAYQEKHPDAAGTNIIMLLAVSGPKVDADLGHNEVKIQPGFIRLKAAKG